MTIVDLAIGFVVGIATTTVAFELGIKKFLPKRQTSNWVEDWDLTEVGRNPMIVAEKITGVRLPDGARVIVTSKEGSLDAVPDNVDLRVDPEASGNFVVGESRALLFNSIVHPGAPAIRTVDEMIVDKLHRQFDRMWYGGDESTGDSIVEDEVSAEGIVVDVEQTPDGAVAKLSSQGRTLPVAVANGQDLEGQAVRVSGKVVYRDGERVLQADRVERTGQAP